MRPNGGSVFLSVRLSMYLGIRFYPLFSSYPTRRFGWGTSVVGLERLGEKIFQGHRLPAGRQESPSARSFHQLSRNSVGSELHGVSLCLGVGRSAEDLNLSRLHRPLRTTFAAKHRQGVKNRFSVPR